MVKKLLGLFIGMAMFALTACGGDKNNNTQDSQEVSGQAGDFAGEATGSQQPVGSEDTNDTNDTNDTRGSGESGGSGESAETEEKPATCCNNITEGLEECDDGCNDDDEDGCTNTCSFTCSEDSQCSDGSICNGEETCDKTSHTCQTAQSAKNGTACGAGKACIKGVCTDITCDSDDECLGECDPLATCDVDTGICKPGRPIAENTICKDGDGYCQAWLCVENTCGDGIQEPNEECDLGQENGGEGSCTENCTEFVCGDGKIEGNEQCDDGNTTHMDGCDKHCKIELVYRLTRLEITTEPADEFCAFADSRLKGNAVSYSFPDDPTMLDMLQNLMNSSFENGSVNYLVYISGLDDPSCQTPDPTISLGQIMGIPREKWASRENKLDFPFDADVASLDENMVPKSTMPMELVIEDGKSTMRTTHPITLVNETPEGDFSIYKTMTMSSFGLERSAMEATNGVEIPETFGDPNAEYATGFICGAVPTSALEESPLPEAFANMCIEEYNGCAQGEEPADGDCDSVLSIYIGGCTTVTGTVLIRGIGEPDADIDNDGVNDAFSQVVKISAQRVRLMGSAVAEPLEAGCNCNCLCENDSVPFTCTGSDCVTECTTPCTEACSGDPSYGTFTETVGGSCRDSQGNTTRLGS